MSFSVEGCRRALEGVGGTEVVCCSCWGMADGAGRVEEEEVAAAACGLAKDPACKTWACWAGWAGAWAGQAVGAEAGLSALAEQAVEAAGQVWEQAAGEQAWTFFPPFGGRGWPSAR